MRFLIYVDGIKSDFNNNDLFKPEKLQVNYTEDKIGKMLSIGDGAIQFSIPFDAILKKIEKGGR